VPNPVIRDDDDDDDDEDKANVTTKSCSLQDYGYFQ
jgi:hypothetical protein